MRFEQFIPRFSTSYDEADLPSGAFVWAFTDTHLWLADLGLGNLRRVGRPHVACDSAADPLKGILYHSTNGEIVARSMRDGTARRVLTAADALAGKGSFHFQWFLKLARGRDELVAFLRDDDSPGERHLVWFSPTGDVTDVHAIDGTEIDISFSGDLDLVCVGGRDDARIVRRSGELVARAASTSDASRFLAEGLIHCRLAPSGECVAIGHPNGLVLWDIQDNTVEVIEQSGSCRPAWCEDEKRIWYMRNGSELRVATISTGERTTVVEAAVPPPKAWGWEVAPVLSPRGRYVLATICSKHPRSTAALKTTFVTTIVVDNETRTFTCFHHGIHRASWVGGPWSDHQDDPGG